MKATKKQLEQRRKYHEKHREEENEKAKLSYRKNRELRLEYHRQYYASHKAENKAYCKVYREKNKEKIKQKNKELYYKNHAKNLALHKEYHKRTYNILRIEALTLYGNGKAHCVCCGEINLRFLTLDHINNDGYLHRKKIGTTLFRWLKTNNYPKGFQTLCFNCNCGRALNNGICPHEEKIKSEKRNLPPIHLKWQGVA